MTTLTVDLTFANPHAYRRAYAELLLAMTEAEGTTIRTGGGTHVADVDAVTTTRDGAVTLAPLPSDGPDASRARGAAVLAAYTAGFDLAAGEEPQVASLVADLLAYADHADGMSAADVLDHARDYRADDQHWQATEPQPAATVDAHAEALVWVATPGGDRGDEYADGLPGVVYRIGPETSGRFGAWSFTVIEHGKDVRTDLHHPTRRAAATEAYADHRRRLAAAR